MMCRGCLLLISAMSAASVVSAQRIATEPRDVALHAGKRRQGGEEKQIASVLITKLSKPGVKVRAGVVARDWR
jgi:hypothetical protein